MSSVPAHRSERADRRARGDGLVWLLGGVLLIILGWVGGWTYVGLLGGFLAVPAVMVLIALRRDRVRRGVSRGSDAR